MSIALQAAELRQRLGELGALDITHPSGRFMLNLSRAIDRLVALRLQVGGHVCGACNMLSRCWVTRGGQILYQILRCCSWYTTVAPIMQPTTFIKGSTSSDRPHDASDNRVNP
jgi:hypothetical protein